MVNEDRVNRALMKAIGVFFTELSGAETLPPLAEVAKQWMGGGTVAPPPRPVAPEHDPTPTEDELMNRKLRMISLRAAAYPRSEEAQKQGDDPDRALRLLTDPCAYVVILQYYVELLDAADGTVQGPNGITSHSDHVREHRMNHIMESIYVLPDNAPSRLERLKGDNNNRDLQLYAGTWDRINALSDAMYDSERIDIDDYNQILFKLGDRPEVLLDAEEEDAA